MFCIFSNVRYSNPKLMHVAHQYMEQTFDPKQFIGLLELQTFHISPDKGLGIFTFDNQQNMTKYLPNLKAFNKDITSAPEPVPNSKILPTSCFLFIKTSITTSLSALGIKFSLHRSKQVSLK